MSEPETLAAQILRGVGFIAPPAVSRADDLIRLAKKSSTQFDAWYAAIEEADTRTLIATIGAIGRADEPDGSRGLAFREAARSMVEQKLTDRMVERMEALEAAATRLGWIGVGVGVVGVVVAIAIAWVSA